MSKTTGPPYRDVLRFREEWRPVVTPFLEPGEVLQVVVPASTLPPAGIMFVVMEFWPFYRDKDKYLLVATDRAWLVLAGRTRHRPPFRLQYRGRRDIRIESSWFSRFSGLDRPYSIEAWSAPEVQAANEALTALQQGRPWDLSVEAAAIDGRPLDPASQALGGAIMTVGKFIPRRPAWLRRMRDGR